ncbi:MAG: hypothetical protein JNM72_00615 [Deltaproteobacteria bacterium]|nr:hypothetical protein [Deltaproteobacteria bacterium]
MSIPRIARALTHAAAMAALLTGLAAGLSAPPAQAGRGERACAPIMPAQRLTTERAVQIEGALSARVPGLGQASVEGSKVELEQATVSLLAGDELARAWTVYQLCVLKEEGTITATTHDTLLRQVLGGPTTSAPAGGGAGAGPAPITDPVAGFVTQPGVATLVIAQCPHRVARDTTPAVGGLVHWKINDRLITRGPGTGFAIDLPPGRVSAAARYTSLRDQLEFTVEAGQLYALVVDWEMTRMKRVKAMHLRPAAQGELGPVLDQCIKRDRVEARSGG